jgi:3-oxoadipate enol-lactonase
MGFIRTSRITLYVERAGEGLPLLYITGTGGDLRVKPSCMDSPLARAFDFVSYDQRGLGQSDKPPGPYTMADYADDAASLLDELGWARANVIGYSFGGMVAQYLATRHPQRIERLVLAATSPGGAGGSSFPLHDLRKRPLEERITTQVLLDARLTPADLAAPTPALQKRIDQTRGLEDRLAADPVFQKGFDGQIAARKDHDRWDALAGVTAPTLVCAGLHDRMARPESSRAMAERIPGAQLRWYDGAHGFQLECPDFYDDVTRFLRGEKLAPNGLERFDEAA